MPITKALDLDISDREDQYSDVGTTNNAKVSVRYQPVDILTVRGAASTGFRAPTLYQLYSPPFLTASDSPTMGSGNPLCSPGHYTAEWTPTVCGSQGLALNGGNINLKPETAKLRSRFHRLADPGYGHYAGLLQNPAQERRPNHSRPRPSTVIPPRSHLIS